MFRASVRKRIDRYFYCTGPYRLGPVVGVRRRDSGSDERTTTVDPRCRSDPLLRPCSLRLPLGLPWIRPRPVGPASAETKRVVRDTQRSTRPATDVPSLESQTAIQPCRRVVDVTHAPFPYLFPVAPVVKEQAGVSGPFVASPTPRRGTTSSTPPNRFSRRSSLNTSPS